MIRLSKSSRNIILTKNENLIKDEKLIAETFNEYFVNVSKSVSIGKDNPQITPLKMKGVMHVSKIANFLSGKSLKNTRKNWFFNTCVMVSQKLYSA